ncbi:MAG: ketol-acid reductoisomerase [Rickettsiales bacterium]
MLMQTYHDADCDLPLIVGKKIAIIGYGSQGHAHALNLRDSGVKEICVALREESPSREAVSAAGLKVMSVAEAAASADVVMILTPDETQAELYANDIAPNLKPGASLAFAHGFNVHFGFITPVDDVDVWMVAPKEIGPVVRSEYEKGSGVPCLVAIAQDATGKAKEIALSYAAAIGGGRIGVFETSFAEECEVDLFGEQAVLFGGLPPLMRAGFDTLVEAGYAPEIAYFKCVQQVKLVADAIAARGISGMNELISNTAEYGGYIAEDRLITDNTKQEMKRLLGDIQNGTFAKDWMAEHKTGGKTLMGARGKAGQHPMEAVGKKLRDMMSWTGGKKAAR